MLQIPECCPLCIRKSVECRRVRCSKWRNDVDAHHVLRVLLADAGGDASPPIAADSAVSFNVSS